MCDFLKLHVDRQNSGMSCCSYYNDKELKQSEAFSLLICLDDIKFVLLSLFTHIETIWQTIWLTICVVVIFRDDCRTGCRNVSHCQQQQSYSGLRSPGRSKSTYFWVPIIVYKHKTNHKGHNFCAFKCCLFRYKSVAFAKSDFSCVSSD